MNFEKIKPAVEEIALDDIQKAKILNCCKNKKRKFNYKPIIGIASAAAAITVVLASPGFLFRASKSNDAQAPYEFLADSMENGKLYNEYADDQEMVDVNTSLSFTSSDLPLFEAEEFHDIYAIIPFEFSSLVDEEEYKSWSATVTSDGGMAMAQFVEYFNISRNEFETANNLYNERILAHISDTAVSYDADIIYSGSREQIDDFYKK